MISKLNAYDLNALYYYNIQPLGQLQSPFTTPPDFYNRGNGRSQFQKDFARILYSSSYRRLQGKMQFLGIDSKHFYRNRLTHSNEVLQIARVIANDINDGLLNNNIIDGSVKAKGEDPINLDVIHAISLAHDIGNPPFGHKGESVLNDRMRNEGGFEGNAQTFRILEHLEHKFPGVSGLCLSKRSLTGIVKYFKPSKDSIGAKFLYDEDYNAVKEQIVDKYKISMRTIDAQIMDLADEIAYAGHDLEDALRQRLFSVDELLYEFEKSENYSNASETLEKLIDSSKKLAKKAKSDTSEDFQFYLIKELTSEIVNRLVQDIGLVNVSNEEKEKTGSVNDKELGYTSLASLAKGLKKITFECTLKRPDVVLYEEKGEKIIEGLFDALTDTGFNKDYKLLPPEYRRVIRKSEVSPKRAVCDYISGMMDTYAIETYKEYYGKEPKLY